MNFNNYVFIEFYQRSVSLIFLRYNLLYYNLKIEI